MKLFTRIINAKSKKLLIALSCFFTLATTKNVAAQSVGKNPYLNSWFSLGFNMQLSKRFSLGTEIHERPGKFLDDQGLLILRPFVSYNLDKNLIFTLGYSYLNTQSFSPLNQPLMIQENNVWEQMILKHEILNVKFQNRLRIEHRWIENVIYENGVPQKNGFVYKNRFRNRMSMQSDIFQFKNQKYFIRVFDELWFNIGTTNSPISVGRNWIYGGLGILFDSRAKIQIGYLNQVDISDSSSLMTHVVQLSFSKNFNFKTKKEEKSLNQEGVLR
jgi:Protein of unknown function (DUF2490)